ncbi:MAG: hypothetical protein DRN37_11780 [Thermoplasmata archaeon]|nr:MAG: hypothetical protein DRN37_11780 [Thermoplasmata archaeon]
MVCRRICLAFTLMIFLFAAAPASVFAEEMPIGKIEKIEGKVTILKSDGLQVLARTGGELFAGDRIQTGKGARVWFSLQPGTRFLLGEEAEASVDELSSYDEEDDHPVLRLVLGYLWSKLQKIMGRPMSLSIHTPTAVIGVRGTEFDTVVSMDAASAIAVDEGEVAVEAEEEKVTLRRGSMTHVEMDVKPSPPEKAAPKEKRNWKAWREARSKMLIRRLPRLVPRLRRRFDKAVMRSRGFTGKVNQGAQEVRAAISRVKEARGKRSRQEMRQALVELKQKVKAFKKAANKFRHVLNRVHTMGGLSRRLEKFVERNKLGFSSAQLAVIEPNLARIAEARKELRSMYRDTIRQIKQTTRAIRRVKRQKAKWLKAHPRPGSVR